jgi:hypothetical protein
MNAEDRPKELFAQALQRNTAAERDEYLAEACAGQPELRQQVESLLAAHERQEIFWARLCN